MQLFEFFTELDKDRYTSDNDITVYDKTDTRKSRLTLEMINQLRHHMQSRRQEKTKSIEMYQKMYGGSVADTAEVA
mgnify:FL=1|tara:strand:- start:1011 stop:1238 length:228 start_codon:yes stop_codon:yes gene_type:complete